MADDDRRVGVEEAESPRDRSVGVRDLARPQSRRPRPLATDVSASKSVGPSTACRQCLNPARDIDGRMRIANKLFQVRGGRRRPSPTCSPPCQQGASRWLYALVRSCATTPRNRTVRVQDPMRLRHRRSIPRNCSVGVQDHVRPQRLCLRRWVMVTDVCACARERPRWSASLSSATHIKVALAPLPSSANGDGVQARHRHQDCRDSGSGGGSQARVI